MNVIKVELLKRVREALPRTREKIGRCPPQICWALDHVMDNQNTKEVTAVRSLRRLIQKRLKTNPTLSNWLVTNGHVASHTCFSHPDTYEKLQTTRIAWIDSLIEEFS